MNPSTILIFEPLSGGHRANFIHWLRDAATEAAGCRFIFFTAEEAGDLHLETLGWWRKQKKLYDLFRQACVKYRPDRVLALELTHLELPLLLFGSPVPLSAILFVQYPELPRGMKFFVKHWKTRLLLRRAPLRNLFLLNGQRSCRFLSAHFPDCCRFIPIADPAPDAAADSGFSLRDHFRIDPAKRVCLFFGAISKRKGAHVLLDTLKRLNPAVAAKSAFVFCGAPEPDYAAEFKRSIAEIRDFESVEIHFECRFVSDGRMIAMFEQADLILMPYTRPEYSSGILAMAARAGTPVLGPPGGLLGRLILENGLGLAAELTPEVLEPPVALTEALRQQFSARSAIENFTKPILDAVCNES